MKIDECKNAKKGKCCLTGLSTKNKCYYPCSCPKFSKTNRR